MPPPQCKNNDGPGNENISTDVKGFFRPVRHNYLTKIILVENFVKDIGKYV